MYDKLLIVESLENIEGALQEILDWTSRVNSVSDLMLSPEGVILLNAVCMKLFAVGEEVKTIDRRTSKTLLASYPTIPWKDVMGMRDIIAHHYFEIDVEEVFRILQIDVRPLLTEISQIKADLRG